MLRSLASKLPHRVQQELKRVHFAWHMRQGKFDGGEIEFDRLRDFVSEGDWVLDIGANVGHYAARLSDIVGSHGRVIAFEPVPATFELLSSLMVQLPQQNVTLLNVAASDSVGVLGMSIPQFDSGLDNYYMAHLSKEGGDVSILTLPVDHLHLPEPVKLVKIDAEGHEISVLKGMRKLLERDHPRLIVEGESAEVESFLRDLGYSYAKAEGSPNRVYSC
jgi:FkbM family methyltransferase